MSNKATGPVPERTPARDVKVFISADIEGISGVVHHDHTGFVAGRTEEYARARRLMTRQVNAAVAGALEGGADLVVVNDSHGTMRNILFEELHPKARLVTGSPKPLSMMQGVEGCDAAFLVGYHARAGAPGVLNHTYSSRTVYELRINDQVAGETLLNAGIAGYYGVPVILVTGDDAATAEAGAVLDGARLVTVKESVGRYAALCLSLEEANAQIQETAREAVAAFQRRPVPPHPAPSPARFEIRFLQTAQADAAAMIPGTRRLDSLTVAFTDDDYIVAFRAARAMITMAWSVESY